MVGGGEQKKGVIDLGEEKEKDGNKKWNKRSLPQEVLVKTPYCTFSNYFLTKKFLAYSEKKGWASIGRKKQKSCNKRSGERRQIAPNTARGPRQEGGVKGGVDFWCRLKGERRETQGVCLLCMCLGTHTVRPEHMIYFRIIMLL